MIRKFITFSLLLVIAISCSKTADVVDYGPTDKKIIEDYITAHNITGAKSTASGLYYVIQKPGSTNHPSIKSYVSVNYKGYLTDGTVFDSSCHLGQPYSNLVTIFVKGWQEGLPLVGAGGKIQLFIPSALGYGSTVMSGIPANSVILFDIELVDFY